jgi:hypothetical protein
MGLGPLEDGPFLRRHSIREGSQSLLSIVAKQRISGGQRKQSRCGRPGTARLAGFETSLENRISSSTENTSFQPSYKGQLTIIVWLSRGLFIYLSSIA